MSQDRQVACRMARRLPILDGRERPANTVVLLREGLRRPEDLSWSVRLAERGHAAVRAAHGAVFQYLDDIGTTVSLLGRAGHGLAGRPGGHPTRGAVICGSGSLGWTPCPTPSPRRRHLPIDHSVLRPACWCSSPGPARSCRRCSTPRPTSTTVRTSSPSVPIATASPGWSGPGRPRSRPSSTRSRLFSERSAWDEALTAQAAEHRPDLVVCAGFMRLLGPAFLEAFGGRTLNSHPALLPAFPGMHGPRDALAYGVKITGATVFLVDAGIDTGVIVDQVRGPGGGLRLGRACCTSASRSPSGSCWSQPSTAWPPRRGGSPTERCSGEHDAEPDRS